MNNLDEIEAIPKWYFKLPDIKGKEQEWELYKESNLIEKAYQEFLFGKARFIQDDNISKYRFSDSNLIIDFNNNCELNTKINMNLKSVSRIYGIPKSNKNTLTIQNNFTSTLSSFQASILDSYPKLIKSSMLFDNNQGFLELIYFEAVLKIFYKFQDYNESKDDLIKISVEFINDYEQNKSDQLNELNQFKSDILNEQLKFNAIYWYIKDSFVNRMVNTAFKKQDFLFIYKLRKYLYFLNKNLMYNTVNRNIVKLYKVQRMSRKEIESLKNHINQPFLLNGITCATGSSEIAFKLLSKLDENERVLFEIDAVERDKMNYICINESNELSEYIIYMNPLFKISKIEKRNFDGEIYFHIFLKFSDIDEYKSLVSPFSIDRFFTISGILDLELEEASLYLIEILYILRMGQDIITLLKDYKGNSESTKQSIFKYLGLAFYQTMEYEKALNNINNYLNMKMKVLGLNHPEISNVYNTLGRIYQSKGENDKALTHFKKSLDINNNILGNINPETTINYTFIGLCYNNLGEFNKALESLKKALSIHKELLGFNHPETARSFYNIGCVYFSKGENDKALEFFHKSVIFYESMLSLNYKENAISFRKIGECYKINGQIENAIEFHLKSLELIEFYYGKFHPETGITYHNIGETLSLIGDNNKALEFLYKAIEVREFFPGLNHLDLAESYKILGDTNERMNLYDKALEFYFLELRIYQIYLGFNHLENALKYLEIGNTYKNKGEYEESLKYYFQSLKILEDKLGYDHLKTAIIYSKIGLAYGCKGDSDISLEYHLKAVAIYDENPDIFILDIAKSYSSIGEIYFMKGEYELAVENYLNSIKIYKKIKGNHEDEILEIYSNIGNTYKCIGDDRMAAEFHSKAMKVNKGTKNSFKYFTSRSLNFNERDCYKSLDLKRGNSGVCKTNFGSLD